MATDIMATSTTELTHQIRLARSFRSRFIKNAPRFARRSDIPYTPWVHQIMRPPPERSGHIEQTWENHVKWYNKRREHAMIWLMKRAIAAHKHIQTQRRSKKILLIAGKKAKTYLELAQMAVDAFPNFKHRVLASRQLIIMSKKARRHKKKQVEGG